MVDDQRILSMVKKKPFHNIQNLDDFDFAKKHLKKPDHFWKSILWMAEIKGLLHPKMKILSLITPCRSKPVKASFVFGTQFKIFWMKTGRLVAVPLTAK